MRVNQNSKVADSKAKSLKMLKCSTEQKAASDSGDNSLLIWHYEQHFPHWPVANTETFIIAALK